MDDKARKLKEKREKAEAELRELKRKERQHANIVAEQLRKDDTRRKVIDGAHIQAEALTNPEIETLLVRLRSQKLIHDTDRALFGLAPLPNEEKARRLEYQRSAAAAAPSEKSDTAPAPAEAPASDAPKLKVVGK